ncbi:dihydroxy-acid dehydratase [Phyllobacterium sp. 0TCS1.6C]|uniref:IlvD/Edd family dehydratase n=1 Tax=unclassified Phyllobacterium TaxID=2638441 RepID=UPI0022651B57|nr:MULTISPECIES: IlvD/Edd family dehydratase [unclassified Phyllobacterium]MCX8279150.1 dihydroxy-acid dehydratase [Phyllobacterium sp. 0TCS1.6C]MCX8293934.1 dihydroxy-acid dehydratase [Phyllobacterium sp. 0TCS1.6A]
MSEEPKGMKRGLANYGDAGFSLFLRKAFIKAMGYSDSALERPIIGITNTFSGYNACHRSVPDLIEAIKRGVMLAGGLPIEFPIISMHEAFSHPTSMFLRNLMAMDAEEMIRAQPMDAVVLIGGCDKTVPALLMGAASVDLPAILTVTGPMITGSHKGERLGACTDCRRFWGQHRAGTIDETEIEEIGNKLAPGPGTCMVMGTASTMALVSEAMGMMLPGGAAIPAVHADRLRHAEATGERAVALASEKLRPSQIMTKSSMTNALRVLQAVGGSTNGVVHLAAIAGRLGFDLDLGELDRLGSETPVLVDLKPSGQHYMEDLFKVGGLTAVLREIEGLIDGSCLTVSGTTLSENIAAQPEGWSNDVVRPVSNPIHKGGGIRVLRGNLAPNGAIIKQAAATPALLNHTGRAVVFSSLQDMAERLDSPDLDVEAEDILILQNAGPKGAPGMPEAGYIPIPRKLAAAGVKDMVRMSDARMSGTAFGAIVLHISPEAAVGGPLALVRNGDRIRLDVANGELTLLVENSVLETRRAEWSPPAHTSVSRGYAKLYFDEVLQAEDGCDFNFLRAKPRP